MKFAILTSEKDEAGKNIFKQIHENFPMLSHYLLTDKDTIYADNIDKTLLKDYDFIIFASKHESREHRKTLSLHAPGNWKQADLGGKTGKICKTSAFVLKYLFQQLKKNAEQEKSDYETTLEVTHHGPYMEKPCLFIEIGSSEKQWKDEQAAKIIAKTISDLQNYQKNLAWKVAIGIGGPHYCPNFNKIQLNSEYAIGHIIPEYAFPLTEEILNQATEKAIEKPKLAILDWKGLGKSESRKEIIRIIEKLGLKYLRTSEVEK